MSGGDRAVTRREAMGTLARLSAVALLGVGGCRSATGPGRVNPAGARLQARPASGAPATPLATGLTRTTVSGSEVLAYLPPGVDAAQPLAAMLFLHGAGRGVEGLMTGFRALADATGVLLVMPTSTQGTWDGIFGTFGPDVAVLDATLAWLFAQARVDAARLGVGGFSDGATYALAVGLANGDLFSRVVAHAPGGLLDVNLVGRPRVGISHGTADPVLPYSTSSTSIVPRLERAGYDVDFHSFQGGHVIAESFARAQLEALAVP